LWLIFLLAMQFDFPYSQPPNASDLRPLEAVDDGFVFCRLAYDSDRTESDGNGWATDFPRADINFMTRLSELTITRNSSRFKDMRPSESLDGAKFDHWVVKVGDRNLFLCPFVVTSDVGTMNLSETDALNLRNYLLKGGLLWVDDFWGTQSWYQWMRELRKVFPDRPVLTPTFDHPIYNTHYNITKTLQVSNVNRWLSGIIQERGEDSPETPLQIVVDDYDRVMIVMTHNSDVQDTWEQEAANADYMATFSPDGYALGINILLYAMSH
jgi:hypothetical protein